MINEEWIDAARHQTEKRALSSELVEWLSRWTWSHWLTGTFKRRRSKWGSLSAACHYLAAPRSSWTAQAALYACEPHPSSPERWHVHVLLSTDYERYLTSQLNSKRASERNSTLDIMRSTLPRSVARTAPGQQLVSQVVWRRLKADWERYFGWCRAYPCDHSMRAATAYCIKYSIKSLKSYEPPGTDSDNDHWGIYVSGEAPHPIA